MPELSLGLDFGTTNSVLSGAKPGESPFLFNHAAGGASFDIFRSVLCFWQDHSAGYLQNHHDAGPSAMMRVIEGVMEYRYVQSFKTFAASNLFDTTRIYGVTYDFSDLLSVFLQHFFESPAARLGAMPERIVVGRPVRYAGASPDDQLAMDRYDAAFHKLGIKDVHYVYEPVAAAYHFAQRLESDATILVGDFGGGTSDFSVIRFTMENGSVNATPLGHAGIGIAGDSFDARIIDNIVAPAFGKGSTYKSWGQLLTLPRSYFDVLAHWEQLSSMQGTKAFNELEQLIRNCTKPEKIETFVRFVEEDLGHDLYRAVNETKTALSSGDTAHFDFNEAGIRISADINRHEFERWIEKDLNDLAASIDSAVENANVTPNDIDKVFLTGGTSMVPAVRGLFESRFGPEKIESGDELLSVASGLALIGLDPNLDRWTVR